MDLGASSSGSRLTTFWKCTRNGDEVKKIKKSWQLFLYTVIVFLFGTLLSGCATFKAYSGLSGYSSLKKGDCQKALAQYKEALQACEKDHYFRGIVLNHINIGCSYSCLGEYSKALVEYKIGLELAKKLS